TPDVLAYPQDRQGWGHLCRMLTEANLRGEKGAPDLRRGDLIDWGERLSLAVLPELAGPPDEALSFLHGLADRFPGNVRVAVAPAYGGGDGFRIAAAAALADAAGVPLMAVNDVLYHAAERRQMQDVLTAI